MKMKYYLSFITIAFMFFACQNDKATENNDNSDDINKGVVEEVHHAGEYTYLLVENDGKNEWLAVPKMKAQKGDVYYYGEGLLMENFESKELDRTFKKVIFLEAVSTEPIAQNEAKENTDNPHQPMSTGAKSRNIPKQDISIEKLADGYSIADIYADKVNLNGKKVKVKGVVVKYNKAIMEKNWLHIQDGTEHNEKFDMTVTTLNESAVGDTVVVEGVLGTDRDFGFGYFYDVIIEDAELK